VNIRRRPRIYKRKGDAVWSFYFFDEDGRKIYRKTDILLSSPRKTEQLGALRGARDTRWVMRVPIGLRWLLSGIAIFLIRYIQSNPAGR
jgi:hypothetical protein